MIKNYYIILILFCCAFDFGYGQIITFDFNGLAGDEVSATSNFNDPNLGNSTITRGAGLTATNNADRFNANDWAATSIANAVAGDNYMEFTIAPSATYEFDVTTIDVNFERSGTGPRGIALRSSLDGYAANIDTEKVILDNGAVQTFTFTVNQTNNATPVTYRVYGWAEATGGTGGFEGPGNDIIVNGSVSLSCTPTQTLTSFAPTEGPIGTVVTITGDDFTNTTTVDFNGTPSTSITYLDLDTDGIIDTLLAEVPTGTSTGVITVTEAGCPDSFVSDFTIIDTSGGCISSTLSDIIMTELYDKVSGSLGYIEIFNGTGAPINLSGYSIRRYGDADDLCAGFYTSYSFPATTPIINNNQVLYGKVFSPAEPPDDATPDFTFDIDCANTGGTSVDCLGNPFTQGINNNCGGFNGNDIFHLYNGLTLVDVFVVPSANVGFTSLRDTNTSGPNPASNPGDWTHNTTENISDLGSFVYTGSTITFPTTTNPATIVGSCINTASFNSTGTASASGALTYQWYFNDGASATWNVVNAANLPLTTITGATTATLTLTGNLNYYDNYQFYCLVTESGSCSTRSNAAQLKLGTATWTNTNWVWNNGVLLGTVPTLTSNVIINEDYDTAVGGIQTSFSACNLIVNPTFELRVSNSNFIEIQNNVAVETGADIIVDTQGAFIQRGIGAAAGTFVLNGTASSQVNKLTAPLANWYNYTYWSSPVSNADVDIALASANANRRFYFNANNFNSSIVPDIDDEGDDWTLATGTGTMIPGRGYAATHTQLGFMAGTQYQYNFVGAFNNGDISYPVAYNPANTDHWNLLGNPYPSAIQVDGVDGFLNRNSGFINPAVYLWSHSSPPLLANPGNEVLNFNTSDYAIINNTMSIPGSSGITPGNYIPSGQSFFVSTIQPGSVTFTNAMRLSGNNSNDIFFRGASEHDAVNTNDSEERLWITLSTEEGIFSQLGVGYIENATDAFDGLGYDAKRNFSSGYPTFIYSRIPNEDFNLAIQGKANTSLNENEVIPLGFKTNLTESYIYAFSVAQLEGDFLNSSPIYLKDNLLNILHNLKQAAYTFSATAGQFNDRFEIVFRESALSVDDNQLDENHLSIIEQANGSVTFKVTDRFSIAQVEILDLLGRTVYRLKGQSAVEVYDLSQLRKAAYIAKVTLSNGQTITKKAIKQR